jgi:xylulokinase
MFSRSGWKSELLLGVDIGTHSLRAVAAGPDGRVRAKVRIPYRRRHPHAGWAEQDAGDWWRAFRKAVRTLLAEIPPQALAAVCFAHQRGTIVPADRNGRAVHPALCDSDQRAGEELETLKREFGAERLYRLTGCPAIHFTAVAKIAWIRRRMPEVWTRAAYWLTPHDYLVFRLTGRPVTSASAMLRTGLLDLHAPHRYAGELLDYLGLRPDRLPEIAAGVIGRVSPRAARTTGLPEGLPVVGGVGDQIGGLIAMGVLEEGAAINMGTSFVLTQPIPEPRFDPARRCTVELIPGVGYALETGSGAGSNMIDWMRDLFGMPEGSEAKLTEWAERVEPGSEGLKVVPTLWRALGGSGGAAIEGITVRHGRGHLFRALLEGLAADTGEFTDRLTQITGRLPDRVYAFGGAAQNALLCRMLSERLKAPVISASMPDASAYGAAVCAAVGMEWYASLKDASAVMNVRGIEHKA